MSPSFEKPPVHVSKSGVSSVSPADILRSEAGQREIAKMVNSRMYTDQAAKPASAKGK
ncbi:MAG TPA: hypothetical protein VFE05_20585 [Longimicrobiaceae bacterium]|jgi:hypothetical protein|nr:hypothetical protein [Longimicrobiaceae bacterium]